MLDEASPHHYCLKTLPINSPKFHIYESWKKTRQGENVISKKCPNSCCELQRKTMSLVSKHGNGEHCKPGNSAAGHGSMHWRDWENPAWGAGWRFWKDGLQAFVRGGEIKEGEQGFGVRSSQPEWFQDIFSALSSKIYWGFILLPNSSLTSRRFPDPSPVTPW